MRAFALSQFHKRHVFLEDHDNKLKVKSTTFKNLNTVKVIATKICQIKTTRVYSLHDL